MTEEKIQLIIGSLLHDVGKIIYRNGDGRSHSISGYDFLKEEVGIEEQNILEAVKYHHSALLKDAQLDAFSHAYITYIADNIAASTDRRKKESGDKGFEITVPLQPVFNVLNENKADMYYHRGMLEESINYPSNEKTAYDEKFYSEVKLHIKENLKGMEWTSEYINSLLEILEGNLTFVPSSTSKEELADISLYDHLKLTAAYSACIYEFLVEKKCNDFRSVLYRDAQQFYDEDAFLFLSMDVSGIQDFIYTIHSEGALKTLRSRSFYLEIMMEHVIDTLLERAELSRANLIYSGGGHCYILLPNTEKIKRIIDAFESELNEWLLEQFDISIYVAIGSVECSANSFKNVPEGSYSELFRIISNKISAKKSQRYTAQQIHKLNKSRIESNRECKICKKLCTLDESNLCKMCTGLINFSKNILYSDFFCVYSENKEEGLPLPFNAYIVSEQEKTIKKKMIEDSSLVRVYTKNKMYSGKMIATKLWVGNYTTGESFEELAEYATGIKRIGILRADVDNLGKTFVSGFENEMNQNKYVTLSRTATLSRMLSQFFKYHINGLLKCPDFTLENVVKKERKATIVYSGGDDLFIVGAWDDILELAIDIRHAFDAYTEGTLSLSAGIGLYEASFPIHISAKEVANMEEEAKQLPGKNAITFLEDGQRHMSVTKDGTSISISDGTYSWKEFEAEVIGEKFQVIYQFFSTTEDYGKNFLYHLLDLIRRQEESINLARYTYLLARMEPIESADLEEKQKYKMFVKKMYQWIRSERDCRQLKTAINLYAYIIREREDAQ